MIPKIPTPRDLDELTRYTNDRVERIVEELSKPLKATADVDMAGFRLVNVGAPKASTDAGRLAEVSSRGTSSGGASARGTAAALPPMPAPAPPLSVVLTVAQARGEYTLETAVTLPSPLGAVAGIQRVALFYPSEGATEAETVVPLAALTTDLESLTYTDGPFKADASDYWAEVAAYTVNGDLAKSELVMSNRVKIDADTGNDRLDGELRDVAFDPSYGDSANGWYGTGLLWKLASKSNCINLKARYEPPLDGIAPAVTTLLKYVKPWVETDVNPAVNGSSLLQGFDAQPYFGNPAGDAEERKGYIEVFDVPISEHTIYLHGLGESLIGRQEFKRVRSATPPSTTRYLSLTLTPEQVASTVSHPLAAITGASVEVEERQTEKGWEGRYKHTFTPPSSDPWYKFTRIQNRWTDSSYVPATTFDQDPGAGPIASPWYSDWWTWPEQDEYHQYRYSPVDLNLVQYLTGAPVVNFHLVGRPKTVTPALPGALASLTVNLTENVVDQIGVMQWYFWLSWTAETPTTKRATLEFEWQTTTPARSPVPMGSCSISQASIDLPRQNYETTQQIGNVLVYVVSVDGARTLVASVSRTIPAGPTGTLNPLQVDLTKTDGFRFNPTTGKLEVTQAGVMARLALGARIGLDVNGALTVTGIVADWVLASLVAVSGSVVVSNAAGSSVTISSDGSIRIEANGGYSLVIGGSGAALLNQALNVIGDLNASSVSTGGTFSQVFGSGTNVFGGSVQSNGSFLGPSGGTPVLQNGATGTFTTVDGKTVTVTNGVITGIV